MASGLPLVSTPVGCVPEIVKEGINGYTVKRDAKDIANKIKLILNNRDKLPAMRTAARETAENYSWDNIAKCYWELAQEVIKERQA